MAADLSCDIVGNVAHVRARIAAACQRAGRSADEVTLVAVSKTRTPEEIQMAYDCGLRHFGENRVEEAETKLPSLRVAFAGDPAIWHMIGHVQSRKAHRAAPFDVVHSLDSLRLAQKLDAAAGELNKRLAVLVEVNTSGEEAKEGFPAWEDDQIPELVAQLGGLAALAHLDVRGLMTMAPIVAEQELARPYFRRLHWLRAMLCQEAPFCAWTELSMGMTDDFEIAIEEGATLVRIGRAIFGPSHY